MTTRVRPQPSVSQDVCSALSIDSFVRRHIGPDEKDVAEMLGALGLGSLEELVERTVPPTIRLKSPLKLREPCGEAEALSELRAIAEKNQVFRSFIGQGYYDTFT